MDSLNGLRGWLPIGSSDGEADHILAFGNELNSVAVKLHSCWWRDAAQCAIQRICTQANTSIQCALALFSGQALWGFRNIYIHWMLFA